MRASVPAESWRHAPAAMGSALRRSRAARWAAAALLVLLGIALAQAPAAPQAQIQYGPLTVPGAAQVLNPSGINAAGQMIVNYMDGASHVRAALLDAKGSITPIAVPGASQTLVYSINNAGQIVGSYYAADYATHGFSYDPATGAYSTIDVADEASSRTEAMGINDLGQIVGSYYTATGEHGFLRDADGRYTTIDAPNPAPGFACTVAAAVNNLGQVAGYYGTSAASGMVSLHGFIRNPDGTYVTVDYPTTPPAVPFTSVTGLNDLGQAVGLTYTPTYRGFVTDGEGGFTPIDFPAATSHHLTSPWGIDGAGKMVGTYREDTGLRGFTAEALAPALPAAPADRRPVPDPSAGALRRLQSALCLRDHVPAFFDAAAPVGRLSAIAEASRRVDLFTTDAVPFVGLVGLEALGYDYLSCVGDISDPSFTTRVTPALHAFPPIPSTGGMPAPLAAALSAAIGHGSRAAGYLQAVSVSLNRYRAAAAAGDTASASARESDTREFARSASEELIAFGAGLRTSAGMIKGTALDESVGGADLLAALAQIRAQGDPALPAIERGGFRMFELDPSYLLTGGRDGRRDGSRPATLSSALLETAHAMDRLGHILRDGVGH
jgi:hypothetical protein